MACKSGVSANRRELERALPTLAMQKVAGSSPAIRAQTTRKTGYNVAWMGNQQNPHGHVEVWIIASMDDGS
jgi:hypothetical protein